MATNWNNLLLAAKAGTLAGEGMQGIGEGIFRAFNGGMTPDQLLMLKLQNEKVQRDQAMQINQEKRALGNKLNLMMAEKPELGITRVPGSIENIPNFGDQFVAKPNAIGQVEQSNINAGLRPMDRQITPLAEGFALDKELADSERLKQLKPVPSQFVSLDDKGRPIYFKPDTSTFGIGELPEGTKLVGKPSSGKSGGGMTENFKTTLYVKAGKFGVNPNDPKYLNPQTNSIDFNKLAEDIGASETQSIENIRKAKLDGMTTDAKNQAMKYMNVLKDLDPLRSTIIDLNSKGKFPGAFENAVAVAANQSPEGFFSALMVGLAKSLQSEDSKQLESEKAQISTALTNAISGAAVPQNERQYLLPFMPAPGDGARDLLIKIGGLEKYLNNRIETFRSGPNSPVPQIGNGQKKAGRFIIEEE